MGRVEEAHPRISGLIATYSRGTVLRETLLALEGLQRDSFNVDWTVIDNNSNDETREVVREFEHRLNLAYLFEPRPGKNCALNKAIEQCSLGEVVLFTDDDITPSPDWLEQIHAACCQYPQHSVFGGRIFPRWPEDRRPYWAEDRFIQAFAYALHDLGDEVQEYPEPRMPFGGNFWVRRQVLESGFRYNERVGPHPTRRVMGSETAFLAALRQAGYRMLYYPAARVEHRIQQAECNRRSLRRRAVRLGRGEIHLSGLPRPGLRQASLLAWRAYAVAKVVYASACWVGAFASRAPLRRVRREVDALRVLGNALECLRVDGVPRTSKPPGGVPHES